MKNDKVIDTLIAMQLVRIENKKSHYYPQFIHLYKTAFPKQEQNPMSLMLKKSKKGIFNLYAVIDNSLFVGLVVIVKGKKWDLLNYLAIDEAARNGGYGSKICAYIQEMYQDKGIILEVEKFSEEESEDTIKKRRLNFYIRNGFTPAQIATSLYGVDFELLTNQKSLKYNEYIEMYQQTFGKLQTKFLRLYEIKSNYKNEDPN